MFLPFAQFQIPFNIDSTGPEPASVQLWVSTDEGSNWQMHGSAAPRDKHFDFRAASEGLYLFSVRTVDAAGVSFPSSSPPLRVRVDTSQPQVALRADINSEGKLVIDVRVDDEHLDLSSALLRLRTDRDGQWRDVPLEELRFGGEFYESQTLVSVAPCREVAIVFAIQDQAQNSGEATFKLSMPRTASADSDVKLASTGEKSRPGTAKPARSPSSERNRYAPASAVPSIAGATPWEPDSRPLGDPRPIRPGRLVGTEGLQLEASDLAEELPLPAPEEHPTAAPRVRRIETTPTAPGSGTEFGDREFGDREFRAPELGDTDLREPASPDQPEDDLDRSERSSTAGQAYHCKSLAFSLDYSVEARDTSALADVELWGTEDGGRTWTMWGSDPDRQSPFDVRVGNEGLFGFCMVIVGANGVVSNRPQSGDAADVWINVDTIPPVAKITRAVYGDGPQSAMLVIDYNCSDEHLVERPISLSFSARRDGPWTTIATGLANTGNYLWKVDPTLAKHVYLKLDVVDKAGNTTTQRLDLPVDIQGLAPRGRIRGFRPITAGD